MKFLLVLLMLGVLFDSPVEKSAPGMEYPVVVELFTSQGCSSCPAADDLLNETLEKASANGRPVIGLSFHVSYWNYLGWKDPYSNEEFTRRQKRYAEALRLQSIYTPQMIVNGENELVGSDRKALETIVERKLHESPRYQISVTTTQVGNDVLVHYSLDKEPGDELLVIAWVESRVQNHVPKGENAGKTLSHFNVVRTLESMKIHKTGEAKTAIPEGLNLTGGSSIVLYIQDPNSLKILGATKTK